MSTDVKVAELRADRLADLATLFGTNKTTGGCYCMWNIVAAKACNAGWSGGNKLSFEALTAAESEPMGLLAYRADEPVGWIAVGPRSRYARMLGTPTLRAHDPAEDARVWFVTCFFVRRDARRIGITRTLLEAAVELARASGATAIEGYPLAGDARRSAGNAFVGVEPLFTSSGFTVVDRPAPARVIVRRNLTPARPRRRT